MLVNDAYALYFCFSHFRRMQSNVVNLLYSPDELISHLSVSSLCKILSLESLKHKRSSLLHDFFVCHVPPMGLDNVSKAFNQKNDNCNDLN